MLTNATYLKGLVLRATDGEIGTVDDFYFDDETWVIRYLTVDTGGWLGGRRVLISPLAITHTDWPVRRLDLALTKKQVQNSPDVNTQLPVSRQHESAFNGYYGYPSYWTAFPTFVGGVGIPPPLTIVDDSDDKQRQSMDSHLRSTKAVDGYHIEAADGEIGHVAGFVIDGETWTIRYVEVATQNWWPGKKVLLSPVWIERVSWEKSKVYVGVSREVIRDAPQYVESLPITREYEDRLFANYGRPPYWMQDLAPAASSHIGVK